MDSGRGDQRNESIPMRIAKSPERWLKKLRRWKSMPTSQLTPSNRPLFACQRCAAVNVYGTICTWCGHACNLIRDKHATRRRISSPQLLDDAQKEQLRLIEKNAAIIRALMASQVTLVAEVRPVRRHRNRDAAIYSLNATTGMVRTNGSAKFFMRSSIVSPVEAATPSRPPASPPSEDKTESATQLQTPSPMRTLRRRKRMSISQRRSSRSLRSRPSKGTLAIAPEAVSARPTTPENKHSSNTEAHPPPSPPRSTTSARLGSPARPLYTAIRKRLTSDSSIFVGSVRSVSPCSQTRATLRPLSVTSEPALSESDEDDMDIADLFPSAPSRNHFRVSGGCSLSGETELRMALSRQRSKTVGGPSPEYIYHDRERQTEFASLMQAMKRISQGMKNLVKSRDG